MTVLHLRFHQAAHKVYGQLFTALADVSPIVEALPPDSALVDVTGALTYCQRSPAQIADLLHTRLMARYGIQTAVGGGPNRMLATMAADTCPPGTIRILTDDPPAIAVFLAKRPVHALPSVGPALARTLAGYGLTSVGDLHALPLATLQRIAGPAAGRLLHEHAQGLDPRRVAPGGPPANPSATRTFARDTLDPAAARRALLSLAVELGASLRACGQAARCVELQVRYADRSTTTRSHALREASNHTPTLQEALYKVFSSLGLQRARIRALTARANGLTCKAAVQLTLDQTIEDVRRLEPTIDRANRRFGPCQLPLDLVRDPSVPTRSLCHDCSVRMGPTPQRAGDGGRRIRSAYNGRHGRRHFRHPVLPPW